MSNFTNITSFQTFLNAGNTVSGGWIGYSLIVTVFIVLTMGTLNYGKNKAIVFSSFTTGILAAFMTYNGLVPHWIVYVCTLIFGISFFMLIQNKQTYGG